MRTYFTKLFIFFLSVFFYSCDGEDITSDTPQISFQSIRFVDTKNNADSLILKFEFKDADGDIGFNPQQVIIRPPYHIFSMVVDANNTLVHLAIKNLKTPLYQVPVTFRPGDEGGTKYDLNLALKKYHSDSNVLPRYNCNDYKIINNDDTVYVVKNERYYNFLIEFFKEEIDGSYKKMDFNAIFNSSDCDIGNFNARIPIFRSPSKQGSIDYAMLSQGFTLAFLENRIKARFYIYDQAVHKSNIIDTPPFRLIDIQ